MTTFPVWNSLPWLRAPTWPCGFLAALGWDVAGEKLFAYERDFKALGVRFVLPTPGTAEHILVANTESRKGSVICDIDAFLGSGTMSPSEAANLKGRLTFCESQHFGRGGSLLAN